jgi:hypothetical protein
VLACCLALATPPFGSSRMTRSTAQATQQNDAQHSRQRDRPGSCSSADVQSQRERAATAKRTAAGVSDLQGRHHYLSMTSKGATNQEVGTGVVVC